MKIRRMSCLILCLTMANAILGGTLAYTDSYSLEKWNEKTNVGPASAVIVGLEAPGYVDDIRSFPGVESAAWLESAWSLIYAYPLHHNKTTSENFESQGAPETPELNTTSMSVNLGEHFVTNFPSIINLTTGRFPNNESEIALWDWLAGIYHVGPGDIVEYTYCQNKTKLILELVGTFSLNATDNSVSYYYTFPFAVVTPELIGDRGKQGYVYFEADRTGITPFSPSASIQYLNGIDESIRKLDPHYEKSRSTEFYLDDLLIKKIRDYSDWLNSMKATQFIRIQAFLFIAILLAVQGVRTFLDKHEKRIQKLKARGASSRQIAFQAGKDTAKASLFGVLLSLPVSTVLNQLALLTEASLERTIWRFHPIIFISFDSILQIVLFGMLAPIILVGIAQSGLMFASRSESSESGIARLIGHAKHIQWDLAAVLLSIVFMVAISQAPVALKSIPIISIIMRALPFVGILGMSSMLAKGLGWSGEKLSKILKGRNHNSENAIGARRLKQEKYRAGIAILILMLSAGLAWNRVIVDRTLRQTVLVQTRFAIGGDIAFNLRNSESESWGELKWLAESHPQVEAASVLNVYGLALSVELQSTLEFVAIDPLEYAYTGYDAQGNGLETSHLLEFLEELNATTNGVVVTADLAELYGIYKGDSLNAFRSNGTIIETLTFVVVGIAESIPDTMVSPNGYQLPEKGQFSGKVGKGRIWFNSVYARNHMELDDSNSDYLCVRLKEGADGAEVRQYIVENAGSASSAISGSVTAVGVMRGRTDSERFIIDRSIDTMLFSVCLILMPFAIWTYTVSTFQERRRETTLLRSLGVGRNDIRRYNFTEMLVLSLYSLVLLAASAPILIFNTLEILVLSSNIALAAFPKPVLFVIAWPVLVGLILGILLSATIVAIGISTSESRIPLREIIDETWDESNEWGRLF